MVVDSCLGLGDLLDLMLLQSAGRYRLDDPAERQRSYRDLRRLFVALQAATRPDFALEMGAYGAEISLALARSGVPVHAFEANVANHARCATAIADSGLPITYHHAAIGAVDGTAAFHALSMDGTQAHERRAGGNSLMRALRSGIDCKTVSVTSVTLAGFLARQGLSDRPFCAAVDIEGAVGPLLAGAGQAFDNCRSILIEVEDRPVWHDQMLAPEVLGAFGAQGFLPVARDFRRQHQYNVILMRPELLRQAAARSALVDFLKRPT